MPPEKRDLEESEGEGGAGGPPPLIMKKKKRFRHIDPEGRQMQIALEAVVPRIKMELESVIPPIVEKVVTKVLTSFFRDRDAPSPSSCSKLLDQNCPPRYKLIFMNSLDAKVFTKKVICGTNGETLKIRVIAKNSQEGIDARILSAKIRVVVLDGDFNRHNQECWTREAFSSSIVRPRDKTGAILTGDLELSLINGEAYLSGFSFIDNSKFVRSGEFRLGVMVVDNFDEPVQEGVTEPFIVMDRRGERSRKHDIPLLNDEVWRLKMIAKDGASHNVLKAHDILSVKDFLRWYYKDEHYLREVLNIGAKDSVWTTIVGHAKKCDPGTELYSFAVEGNGVMMFFNSVCQIIGVKFGDSYTPFDDLEKTKKEMVVQWSKVAYKKMTYDQPDYEMDNGKPRPINQEAFQGLGKVDHDCSGTVQGVDQRVTSSGQSQQCRSMEQMVVTQNGEQLQMQKHLDAMQQGVAQPPLDELQHLHTLEQEAAELQATLDELEQKQHLHTLEQAAAELQAKKSETACGMAGSSAAYAQIKQHNTELRSRAAELGERLRSLNKVLGGVEEFSGAAMGIQEELPPTRCSSHGSFPASPTPCSWAPTSHTCSSTGDASTAMEAVGVGDAEIFSAPRFTPLPVIDFDAKFGSMFGSWNDLPPF